MLQVLLQVNFVLEAVEAARTVVGPLVPVLPTVGDEVGALAEGFSAYVTHVRLLPWHTNTARPSLCTAHEISESFKVNAALKRTHQYV